jgi:hypothetical protein
MIITLDLCKKNILSFINKCNFTFIRNSINKSIDEQIWQYLGIDENGGYFTFANEEDDYFSSIYIVVKRLIKFQKQTILAAQSLDTLTDFNSRGKGFFVECAKSNYDFIENDGVSFVFGFPNKNSFGGFVSKLGWKSLDPVPFLFLPLNINYFIRRVKFLKFLKLPKFNFNNYIHQNDKLLINDLTLFTSEYDSLWDKFSSNISISVVRDSKYLNWRFIDNPTENYLIYSATYNDSLVGFIVINIKNKHDGKIGYVMELIFDPMYPFVPNSLLAYAINIFKSESVDVALAWCFEHSLPYPHLRKSGFYKLPIFLRQIELHFGYKILKCKNDLSEVLSNPKAWYISYSDSDTN